MGVHPDGALDVRRRRPGRDGRHARLTLPADCVASSVELGYATTIHGAQGSTADVCHALVAGAETREQLYTALSRGRDANHVWVQVGHADAHTAPIARDLVMTDGEAAHFDQLRDKTPAEPMKFE